MSPHRMPEREPKNAHNNITLQADCLLGVPAAVPISKALISASFQTALRCTLQIIPATIPPKDNHRTVIRVIKTKTTTFEITVKKKEDDNQCKSYMLQPP